VRFLPTSLRLPLVVSLVASLVTALALVPPAAAADVDYGGYRPHYQGYGVNTSGGRGGSVQRVTHLMDTLDPTNPNWNGSLRKAVTTPGARFVVFEVSGYIRLGSPLIITEPYLTIAGQTAPSPGITLTNSYIQLDTHDVVIQHLRVRPGAVPGIPHGIHIRNGGHNIVLDHVSISWTVWTSIGLHAEDWPAPNIGDVTVIDSLVAEALSCSGVNTEHPCDPATLTGDIPHSRAILAGDNNTSTTYNNGRVHFAMVRTISANNDQRHPAIQGDVDTFIVNNLIYNPSLQPISGIFFSDDYTRGPAKAVVKGNLMIPGPTTPGYNGYVPRWWPEEGPVYMIQLDYTTDSASRIYLDGNYYAAHCGGTACLVSPESQWMLAIDHPGWQGRNVHASTPPISLANFPLSSMLPYTQVESFVTANAGARPLDRDPVDARVINEIRTRTGHSVNTPAEVGGFPSLAEVHRPLIVPSNPNQVVDSYGRTRIEQWLEGMARDLEPANQASTGLSAPTNLRQVR
jgi:hypothetical protein